MRSSCRTPRLPPPGFHVAKNLDQLGIADEVAPRLRTFPNGAASMRELAATEALRPIGCTQAAEVISTRGVTLSGSLPLGGELATMYTAGIATWGRAPRSKPATLSTC